MKVSGLRLQCEHDHLNYIHRKCQQTPVKESFKEERNDRQENIQQHNSGSLKAERQVAIGSEDQRE